MVGGAASFLIMRVAGRGIDRYGAARVSVVGTVVLIGVLYFAFIAPARSGTAGVLAVFVLFMGGHVGAQRQHELAVDARAARRSSAPATCRCSRPRRHISSATGAFVSSRLLHEAPGGRLSGISTVSTISAVLALGLPPLLAAISKRVTPEKEVADGAAPPSPRGGWNPPVPIETARR